MLTEVGLNPFPAAAPDTQLGTRTRSGGLGLGLGLGLGGTPSGALNLGGTPMSMDMTEVSVPLLFSLPCSIKSQGRLGG